MANWPLPNALTRNAVLLLEQLGAWFWPTLLVGGAIVVFDLMQLPSQDHYTVIELVAAAFGILTGLAFLKTAWIFTFYPLIYKKQFEGSFFIIALLVTALLLNSLGILSLLALSRIEHFPAKELPWMLAGVYVVISIFLWANFHVVHWLYAPKSGRR